MSRTKRSFWKISLSVFVNVSYETLALEGFIVRFCECLVRNAYFGRSLKMSVCANVSYETLILEGLFVSFCECLTRNAHFGRFLCLFLRMSRIRNACFGRSLCPFLRMSRKKRSFWKTFGRFSCPFLRMSRTNRSFWKVSLSVFANVSYETLILEVFLVRFCECLVRNAHFGRSLCRFLRMSRTKRSFWKVSLSVFANVSYETLFLEDFFVCFMKRLFWKASLSVFANVSYETLILEGLFGQFLRTSRTKRSFWKVSLSVFANVSHETLILEDFFVCFCECLLRNACFGRSLCPFLRMSRKKRSFWKIFLTPSKGGAL